MVNAKMFSLKRIILGMLIFLIFIIFTFLFILYFDYNSKFIDHIRDIRKYSYSNTNNGKEKCIKEGWMADSVYGESTPCCPGLRMIGLIENWNPEMGVCTIKLTPLSICLKCGDGICGHGENYCNCKDDCPTTKDNGGLITPKDGWNN
jgi:hypothetical protein